MEVPPRLPTSSGLFAHSGTIQRTPVRIVDYLAKFSKKSEFPVLARLFIERVRVYARISYLTTKESRGLELLRGWGSASIAQA